MKIKNLKNEWLQLLIVVLPFCAAALLWDKLPDWVPIHWNASGEVDDYARKEFGAFFLPVVTALVALFMALVPLLDPKLRNYNAEMRASLWRIVKRVRLCLTAFLSFMSLAVLGAALELFDGANFSYQIYVGTGLLFIFLGNLMSKLRPNYFVGIRTPWTIESKEVWMKTHRLGGRLMVLGGFAMLALCFVVPLEQFVYFVLLPVSVVMAVVPMLYSFMVYKRQSIA